MKFIEKNRSGRISSRAFSIRFHSRMSWGCVTLEGCVPYHLSRYHLFQPFLFFLKLITHCLQKEWPQSSDNIGDFMISVHTGHSNKSGSIAEIVIRIVWIKDLYGLNTVRLKYDDTHSDQEFS